MPAARSTAQRLGLWMLAGVVLAALGVGAWLAWRAQQPPQAHFVEIADNAYVLPRPDRLADFSLVRHDGQPFDNAALQGNWTFLFFGYTHCPDICPLTLAVFGEVHRMLSQRPEGASQVRFVFVSVDPERDTPQLLTQYVPHFNPEFIGVTGAQDDLARLSDSVGVMYGKVPGSTPDAYLVDHSSAILLTNPKGRLQGVFAAPHVADKIVEGFVRIRDR